MANDNARKIRDLLLYIQQFGWVVDRARNGHWRISGPDGQSLQVAGTPSDTRAFLNVRSKLRRAGAPTP